MNRLRDRDITYLKSVGPARAKLLKAELGISSYYDLLYHFPTSYLDRSRVYRIADFPRDVEESSMPAMLVKGEFVSFSVHGEGAKMRLVGLFSDGSGLMEIVWFRRIAEIRKAYTNGRRYVVFGKPAMFNGRWSMTHPEVDAEGSNADSTGLRGNYPLTEKLRQRGITSRTIYGLVAQVLGNLPPNLTETLPQSIISHFRLMPLARAIVAIHAPKDAAELDAARNRFKWEELFYLQLDIQRFCRNRAASSGGFVFGKIGYYFNTFYKECLPFELTGAQKRVIRQIRKDTCTGKQMNRLLQGDVGSGKTLVALMSMLIALDNQYQACLMAPTEILATQHFETISSMVGGLGINVKLLTGSTPKKARDLIHEGLQSGAVHILIGTHAVIEDNVKFKNLGMAVIDEQHRFGVAQRARLWTKNIIPPHVLVMTATPIPRTLAMTVYGDLDLSVIDELPPGRKPIVTVLRYENKRMDVYRAIGEQLRQGRQVYIVYPLIEENEKLDLKSLEEGYEMICDTFRDYKIAYVHGRMKPAEKDYQMSIFASGEARIMVATTVIEVGVNVPNATTMVIENAERFGLSQLHQLRGRVGRGGDQSYCILMSKPQLSKTTRERLTLMTQTTDGFVIAEADMKMRGPGDMEGTAQSGLIFDLKVANLTKDADLVEQTRDAAIALLNADPMLAAPDNRIAARQLTLLTNRIADWSRIS
ncbi:MAG: ATP-dependent DNA helicase RecG [Muribaculaceae bacterium]|nr:ATP-dependent DNA helicase RecG [Muribaculaceae bacterium]